MESLICVAVCWMSGGRQIMELKRGRKIENLTHLYRCFLSAQTPWFMSCQPVVLNPPCFFQQHSPVLVYPLQ